MSAAAVLAYLLLAAVVWLFPSKGVQDVVLWAGFVYAVASPRRVFLKIWLTPAGMAVLALGVYTLVVLPFGYNPAMSARDIFKMSDVFAFAFAVPALFNTRRRIESAVLYSAILFTLVFGFDLIRLVIELKSDLFSGAHAFEPFILIHSNVQSMVSGCAFFVLCHFAWKWRSEVMRVAACIAGIAVHLAYQIVLAGRGPQIAFVAAIAVAGFLLLPKWRQKLLWTVLLAAGICVTISRIDSVNARFTDAASMSGFCGRDVVWRHTFELAGNHPITGYGFGRRVFDEVYYESSESPPESPFYFSHPHNYWLYVLFAQGWLGMVFHFVLWGLLGIRLLRYIGRLNTVSARTLPVAVTACLVFLHVYGMGDWPSDAVCFALIWLVPVALTVSGVGFDLSEQEKTPCRT